MCDPVTIGIALATTAAQSYFQNQAAGDVRKAQTRAQTMFDDDVKNQRDTSNIQFQNSVQQAGQGADEQRYEEAVAKRTTANQPSFDQRALLPGQGNASNAVKTAIVQSQDKGISDNARAAAADAKLGAYGDAALGQNINLQRNANRIQTQGNFAQGSLNNLQADMRAAQYAGDKNAGIADMIGAIGTIAGPAVGYGAGQGWWGGLDPNTGITWNTGRQLAAPGLTSPTIKGGQYIV